MRVHSGINVVVAVIALMAAIQDVADRQYGWAVLCCIGSLVNLQYGIRWKEKNVEEKR